jgi:methylthioribose-1-phosphate isomerase
MGYVSLNFKTIEWVDGRVRVLDQTMLPGELVYRDLTTVEEMHEAIKSLRVRGAPLIGIAGAYGAVLSAFRAKSQSVETLKDAVKKDIALLGGTRPTAVNLFWALSRMSEVLESLDSTETVREGLLKEAFSIHDEDRKKCDMIGKNGSALIKDGFTILTHCNAGALATGGIGTALAVIYAASSQGKKVKVFASETRPLLQGARLTAWELSRNGIDVTLLVDGARGHLLAQGSVDCAIVGSDRIAANGDVANKIGTYPLSVLAAEHGVPLYVAAPLNTFDLTLADGRAIPIEERGKDEVLAFAGMKTAPQGVKAFNPAFDVTPHENVSCIITEKGLLHAPYTDSISDVFSTP